MSAAEDAGLNLELNRCAIMPRNGRAAILPLGGGLMSESACWLELSDCPDSIREKQSKR